MAIGGYISTVGHIGLLGYLFFGPGFEAEPLPMEDVQQVSVISEAEFLALTAPDVAPVVPAEPAALVEPEPVPVPEPLQPAPPAPEPVEPAAAPEAPAEPDPVPPTPEPAPEAEVSEEILIPPVPEAPETILEDLSRVRPVARPADRVAPEPITAPEPETQIAEEVREAALPDDAGDVIEEAEPVATSPDEATTEIVTEAEEAAPSGAVARSLRPKARPNRPAPEPERTTETATADAEPTDEASVEDPLAAALNEALQTPLEQPSVPTGPPLTSSERNALRVAVSACWNVGALSTEALGTTVVVAVDMAQNGRPITNSITMVSSDGGSAAAARQAFEAARRAIIRCGASGFDLPREKYDQWRQIEITFNPEQMRIR